MNSIYAFFFQQVVARALLAAEELRRQEAGEQDGAGADGGRARESDSDSESVFEDHPQPPLKRRGRPPKSDPVGGLHNGPVLGRPPRARAANAPQGVPAARLKLEASAAALAQEAAGRPKRNRHAAEVFSKDFNEARPRQPGPAAGRRRVNSLAAVSNPRNPVPPRVRRERSPPGGRLPRRDLPAAPVRAPPGGGVPEGAGAGRMRGRAQSPSNESGDGGFFGRRAAARGTDRRMTVDGMLGGGSGALRRGGSAADRAARAADLEAAELGASLSEPDVAAAAGGESGGVSEPEPEPPVRRRRGPAQNGLGAGEAAPQIASDAELARALHAELNRRERRTVALAENVPVSVPQAPRRAGDFQESYKSDLKTCWKGMLQQQGCRSNPL